MDSTGTLALVGGDEWTEGCSFDATLLAASGGTDVLVLPTAAAYQHPERVVLRAAEWFAPLGAQVEGLMVVDRASAEDPGMAATLARARFVYLAGGSPLHLRAVLKKSAVFDALRTAWLGGAVVAGAGAGAMVLTDPMVDPRGGALDARARSGRQPHRRPPLRRRARRRPRPEARAHGRHGARRAAGGRAAGPHGARARRRGHVARRGSGDAGRVRRRVARPRAWPPSTGLSGVQSFSSMVTLSMTTRSLGVPERLPRASILATTSRPLTTSPKSE